MKAQTRITLAILGSILAVYIGSYVFLSAQGHYGPEFMGSLIDGPEYNWEPLGFHNDSGSVRWNRQTYFYFPLFLLDRSLWHPSEGKGPSI